MKLSAEQLRALQHTLREQVIYKETYEEVYDHVVTALEQSDNKLSPTKTVDSILLKDFGGFAGLRLIERRRRWAVAHQVIIKQGQYLLNHFKFPLLPLTIIIYALIYYLVISLNFGLNNFILFIATMVIANVCTRFRMVRTGYIFKRSKKSIKDSPFWVITVAPFSIVSIFYMVNFSKWIVITPLISALLITLYVIYNISVIKLHKDQFNKLGTKLK